MDVFSSPEAAQNGYYNLPSQSQMDRMLKIVGIWNGEWGLNENTTKGTLEFRKEGEYVNCYLKLNGDSEETQMGISFYGDYFSSIKSKETELNIFSTIVLDLNKLVGQHKTDFLYAIFERQN